MLGEWLILENCIESGLQFPAPGLLFHVTACCQFWFYFGFGLENKRK